MNPPRTGLPPGQTATRKFPVVGEQAPASEALDLDGWRLIVDGLVERPLAFTYAEILALPRSEPVADIHGVKSWSNSGYNQDVSSDAGIFVNGKSKVEVSRKASQDVRTN